MDIISHEFETKHGEVGEYGICSHVRDGRRVVHLFDITPADLHDTKPKIGDHIWTVTQQVIDYFFDGTMKRKDIDWTFSSGPFTTGMFFKDIDDVPVGLSLTDSHAFEVEQFAALSIEGYEAKYDILDKNLVHEAEFKGEEDWVGENPIHVFVVPCESARDEVLYCQPTDYKSYNHDKHEYLRVNAKKLVARVNYDDPDKLDHARRQFHQASLEAQLAHNSALDPLDTGGFYVSDYIREKNYGGDGAGLTMSSGFADVLIYMQELGLPFVPIQIQKASYDAPQYHKDNIEAVKKEMGYGYRGPGYFVTFNPQPN